MKQILPHVILKKYTEEDFDLYARLVFNEWIMKMNYGRVFTEEEARMLFGCMLEANRALPDSGYYKVYSENDGLYIGMGGLVPGDDGNDAEAEYMILPEYRHRGYGTGVLSALLDISRKNGFVRVTAITDPGNVYSRRMLENASFVFEREYINEDGDPAVICRLNSTDETVRQGE